MNGVRRFLGAATGYGQQQDPSSPPSPSPLNLTKSSSSSVPSLQSPSSSPASSTAALFIKKHAPKPSSDSLSSSASMSPVSTKYSPLLPLPASQSQPIPSSSYSATRTSQKPAVSRVSTTRNPVSQLNGDSGGQNRSSGGLNIRDELLYGLLASEAVVDSKDFQILSAEEVEDLKKEYHILSTRLSALSKKLSLETKIRDAAVNLVKANQSTNTKISQKSDEQLEAANKRVDAAQKEYWKLSERANEVHQKLVEHRAGVLSWSVKNMEQKVNPTPNGKGRAIPNGMSSADSGYDSPTSPSDATTFDGLHLFAGHANATVPDSRPTKDHASLTAEVSGLEAKLKAATASLAEATKKQGEMAMELSMLKLEKEEVETMRGMELQNAEEIIEALQKEIPAREGLEAELNELREEKMRWEQEKEEWEDERERRGEEAEKVERVEFEEKEEEITRLKKELERIRGDNATSLKKYGEELEEGVDYIQQIVQKHSIPTMFTRRDSSTPNASLMAMVDAIDGHFTKLNSTIQNHSIAEATWENLRRKLEEDIRAGLDKRDGLSRELEDARREREESRKEARELETKLKERPDSMATSSGRPISIPLAAFPSAAELANDTASNKIIMILQTVWNILPSPEARAAQANQQRTFRPGSSPSSPLTPSTPGSPAFYNRELTGSPGPSGASTPPKSVADLDVRSLKALYDNRGLQQNQQNPQPFSLEGFVARVQALVVDDRALISRLLRFAHAHDMLKKNAERAQKLAQESSMALETYQKQVRILEDLAGKGATAQDELHQLQETLDRVTAEKVELEADNVKNMTTVRELKEANDTLNIRALELAEEASTAQIKSKQELEAKMKEMQKALDDSKEEVEAMRRSEQNQSMMLLDELNTAQTENDRLRDQLRSLKK